MKSAPFHGSARPTLGVELEFQLVDSLSMALKGVATEILKGLPEALREAVKPEFYESCLEINSGVCDDVAAVERDLRSTVGQLARAAAWHGARLAWGGSHPFSHWRDQAIVATPRYQRLADHYRETICRQVTFGLHVHVGVADGDTAVRVCNNLVEYLPILLALSANSPFWCGRDTGLRSYRVEVMNSSPTGGLPPVLASWDDYAHWIDRFASVGMIDTPKDLWWDVRPSSEHGTVELRMCDMPPDLSSVLALTALIQCLVVDLARRDDVPPPDDARLWATRQNRWRASRFGLDAEFVDLRNQRSVPARALVDDLVGRLGDIAQRLGCSRQLASLQALAHGPTGADRQLAVYRRTGSLVSVARQMTEGCAEAAGLPLPETFSLTVSPTSRGPITAG